MPRIFDNIDDALAPALRETLALANRADFCVGYFNLRGWRVIDKEIEQFSGTENHQCRLMVGMTTSADEEDTLCIKKHETNNGEPQLICSLGLVGDVK